MESNGYLVYVFGGNAPTLVHPTLEEAVLERDRLFNKTHKKVCIIDVNTIKSPLLFNIFIPPALTLKAITPDKLVSEVKSLSTSEYAIKLDSTSKPLNDVSMARILKECPSVSLAVKVNGDYRINPTKKDLIKWINNGFCITILFGED